MDEVNKSNDPLMDLINKHKAATGEPVTPPEPVVTNSTPQIPDDEDIYGVNDQQKAIEAEDAAREAARAAQAAEQKAIADAAKEKTNVFMPPDEKDMKYHEEAIGFQTEKLSIVTTMINKVVAKYRLISGAIPTQMVKDNTGRVILDQVAVKGELCELYEKDGEVITPEFENIILENWVMPDGTLAADNIVNGVVVDSTMQPQVPSVDNTTNNAEIPAGTPSNDPASKEAPVPTINITVEKDTPVTVNVDESITANMSTSRVVDIVVKEVSEKELKMANIIENSSIEGIITKYDSGINDVPITLPLSGYRCVMRSINWWDFIKLTAPTSNSPVDNELKKWSVLYDHIKNVSIGDFADFEDFMKKTKYQDRELLMWGLLVATADDEELLEFVCQNPKCGQHIRIKYRPRNIQHIEEDKIPKWWKAAGDAAPGDEAIKVWEEATGLRKRYQLPNTKIIVEINEPSAYDFVTKKLPLIEELLKRYRPDGNMSNIDPNDPTMAEFDYLSANALFVSAMTIVRGDKEYRFTDWSSIEQIITEGLDAEDSGVLLKIIEKARNNVSPISFRVNDITCSACKQHYDYMPIPDIGGTLLFQVSQRLSNTQINLTEMD